MALASTFRPNPNPCTNGVVSAPRRQFGSLAFESNTSLFGSKLLAGKSFSLSARINRPEAVTSASSRSFDVVIIGAGIIGLTIARQFLIGSDLSVAVVDKAVPCSGATGAGKVWSLLVRCLFIEKMLTKERTSEPLPYTVPTLWVSCVSVCIYILYAYTYKLLLSAKQISIDFAST
jgi:hypothetical protein